MNNNKYYYWVFAAVIIVVLFYTNSWKVFDMPPASVHQWRQSDCAAYIKTYYRTGNPLLLPATYNLAGTDGHVASEFPILYYITAKIERFTGEHYWVIRSINFSSYLIGLFALLLLTKRWIRNPVLALFPVVVLATSPFFYYYAINFLPNVPAISFSFVGLYLFVRYHENRQWKFLLSGTFFFMLSAALKPTDGGILWLAFIATLFTQVFITKEEKLNKKIHLSLAVASIIIAGSILGWTKYVNHYNDTYGNHQNLIGILPIWGDYEHGITVVHILKRMVSEWANVFQQQFILLLFFIFLIAYVVKWRQLNPFLRLFTLFVLLGVTAYSILWFDAFYHHDYYQLPFVLAGVFVPIAVIEYLVRIELPKWNKNILSAVYLFCFAVATVSIHHNKNIQHFRYTDPAFVYVNPAMFEIEPYLSQLGVSNSAKVICVPDVSPNISLNAINRYGFSDCFGLNIEYAKSQGAKFLILSDTIQRNNPKYEPYLTNKIGEYKGIEVYTLKIGTIGCL